MNLVERLLVEIRSKRKRVVVMGDAMVDRWVYGELRTGCQDNCELFIKDREWKTPGGAANARACLDNWDVNSSLYTYSEQAYPIKTRYVVGGLGGRIVWRYDDDKRARDGAGLSCKWARDAALEMAGCAAAVLLSDYDKGFLQPDFIKEVVELCRKRGVPCVADCKRAPTMYAGAILKGNGIWAVEHFDSTKCAPGRVVTQGCSEPWFIDDPLPRLLPVHCVNHVGAGDCFAAHLALALGYGFSLKDAAALAHSAGRVYVQHPHNRPPLPAEVAADMETKKAPAETAQGGPTGAGVSYHEDIAGS